MAQDKDQIENVDANQESKGAPASAKTSNDRSFENVIEDQKGVQTARENDHFQADSSLSSEN